MCLLESEEGYSKSKRKINNRAGQGADQRGLEAGSTEIAACAHSISKLWSTTCSWCLSIVELSRLLTASAGTCS
jgi:hypothetical protein